MAAPPPPDARAPIKQHRASPQTPFSHSISALLVPSHFLDELWLSSLYFAAARPFLQLPPRASPVSTWMSPSPFPPTCSSIFPTRIGRLAKLWRDCSYTSILGPWWTKGPAGSRPHGPSPPLFAADKCPKCKYSEPVLHRAP
jgi:hypothetical protein